MLRIGPRCSVRAFMCFSLLICVIMIIIGINILSLSDYDMILMEDEVKDIHDPGRAAAALKEDIAVPLILWWTPFTGERGSLKKCGDKQCFFTQDRHYRHHAQTKAFLYYGTEFKALDLPVPKKTGEEWALLHEESPKNQYLLSHEGVMTLFNHTSTFSRYSGMPITTQYLESIKWLEQTSFLIPTSKKTELQKTEGLAPFFYAHSDCDPPSDRDSLVRMLMKYMKVDSYGQCVHNKDLPEFLRDPLQGMDHEEFYHIQAQYKFSLAFENGICDDYITEKVWRPLMVGSVPVIMGSPKVRDFLPDNHSAILLEDFASIDDFVAFMKKLNEDDVEYERYLEWKRTGVTNRYLLNIMADRKWAINNDMSRPNFIDCFECMVCERIHGNLERKAAGKPEIVYMAEQSHYGCPRPKRYDTKGKQVYDHSWGSYWDSSQQVAKALGYFISNNISFDRDKLYNKAYSMKSVNDYRDFI